MGRPQRPGGQPQPATALATDLPIAGLLTDLKRRGLLDSTLVDLGRRVRPDAGLAGKRTAATTTRTASSSGWPAAGVKGGTSYGETDEIGYKAVRDPVTVHDLHATILHLLGLDHTQLTYLHNGRQYRLTDVAGDVLSKILA